MFDMRVVDYFKRRVDDLCDIVAGYVGRHAHRDAARAVGKQIGEQAGEYLRLLLFPIVGRNELDRAFVEPLHQPQRGLRQPRFGVPIGGGVIAIDIAEVALAFDQRISQREILREADHRIVDAGIAVGVILADHIPHYACGFLERAGRVELQLAHRPQQAAMHGLQPVAKVRQRSCGDRAQCIDQIPFGQSAVERGVDDRVERVFVTVERGFIGGHDTRPTTATPRLEERNNPLSPRIA